MTRRNRDRIPWLLGGALAVGALVLIDPWLPQASGQQPGSPHGCSMMGHGCRMIGQGIGPMTRGDGMCPMGGQMPAVPFPDDEMPNPTSQGAVAFKQYCMQCHFLPSPLAHSADEWDMSLVRMLHRMQMMEQEKTAPWGRWMPNIAAPSAGEVEHLRRYLKDNALRTAPESLAPKSKGPGGVQFAQVCSQCHALPDPALHTAAEWPDVVSRMHANMQRMAVPPPDVDARAQILAFLVEHARS